jgi:hypothetical protein
MHRLVHVLHGSPALLVLVPVLWLVGKVSTNVIGVSNYLLTPVI